MPATSISSRGAPELEVTISTRLLPGRRFSPVAEAEMFPDLLRLAAMLTARAEDVIAIPEFVGPYGVADLVVVALSPRVLEARTASGVEPLTYEADAAVVAALAPAAARSVADVAGRLGWPLADVERRLPKLLRVGAVTRSPRGGLLRHPAVVPVGRVHALEAKVRDWRRGLHQARRYGLWADSSSLVLPRMPAGAVDALPPRVGLAVGAGWLRRPRVVPHTNARRLVTSELVVSALAPARQKPSPAA